MLTTDTILDRIIATKIKEVEKAQAAFTGEIDVGELVSKEPPDFAAGLSGKGINIIAEVKFASPSEGSFSTAKTHLEIAAEYQQNGAKAISVLTDQKYFSGKIEYLSEINQLDLGTPLLCKDFIISEYQIYRAAKAGASAFLLIVACLDDAELQRLSSYGQQLGMQPLVEIHNQEELERAMKLDLKTVGINNRNLKTMQTDLAVSFELAKLLETTKDLTLISESGIENRNQLLELRAAGFDAFLIGSSLMRSGAPGESFNRLLGEARC
jgi:indole-3-glycerol phosphate synthase